MHVVSVRRSIQSEVVGVADTEKETFPADGARRARIWRPPHASPYYDLVIDHGEGRHALRR